MDADALSRLPYISDQQDTLTINADSVSAICKSITLPYVECLAMDATVVDSTCTYTQTTDEASILDMRRKQWEDPVIYYWLQCVRDAYKPHKCDLPQQHQQLHSMYLRNFDRLKIVNDVLVRTAVINEELRNQVVVPTSCVSDILLYLHTNMAHPGRDKTLKLICDRFYWPRMTLDVDNYVKSCKRCVLRKTQTTERAPLHSIHTTQPLELVCTDYLKLEQCKGGIQYILLVTDHFTRYSVAVPTKNQTAKTTADAIFNHFIVHYGIPATLHSDQGAQFEGNIIRELCDIMDVRKSRTTPYHPMSNGITERMNRNLLKMLGTLENYQKADLKKHLSALVHSYNCMPQDSTGFSPYFLLFGREPRLPVDLAFGLDTINESKRPKTKYVQDMKERMRKSYEIAIAASHRAKDKQKEYYDMKTRGAVIQTGDTVLVKIVAYDGRHKIADRWEETPYTVIAQPNKDIPVYTVRREDEIGKDRTLHRNLLLPIGNKKLNEFTPSNEQQPSSHERNVPKPTPKPRKRRKNIPVNDNTDWRSDTTSEHSVEIVTYHGPPAAAVLIDGDGTTVDDNVTDTLDTSDITLDADADDGEDALVHDDDDAAATGDAPSEADHQIDDNLTADDDDDNDDDDDGGPTVTRRSSRISRKPAWVRSGDFIMQQNATQPDWKVRAEYLQQLTASGAFSTIDTSSVATALLNVVSNHKT